MFSHSKSEKNLRSYFHICDSILSDISTDYITSDTLEKLPLTMTTKEWKYLESELDTYKTADSIFLPSEISDETHSFDETDGLCVPMLTKGMSVANLKDIYMTSEDFPSTFEHEEVEEETIPYLSMPSRA